MNININNEHKSKNILYLNNFIETIKNNNYILYSTDIYIHEYINELYNISKYDYVIFINIYKICEIFILHYIKLFPIILPFYLLYINKKYVNSQLIKIYVILQNIFDATNYKIRKFIDNQTHRTLFDYLLVIYDTRFIPYTCLFIMKNKSYYKHYLKRKNHLIVNNYVNINKIYRTLYLFSKLKILLCKYIIKKQQTNNIIY